VLINILMGGAQRAAASGLPDGAFSSLNYAQRSLNLVSGLALSLATVSLTELSVSYGTDGMRGKTLAVLRESLDSACFMLIPLSALLYIVSEPMIALLFLRGRYDVESVKLTGACLRWLTLSVVPGTVLAVLHRAAAAFGRPWRTTVTSAAWTLATVGVTVLILPSLGPVALAAGFSIGTVIATCVSALALRDIVPLTFYWPVLAYAGRTVVISASGLASGLVVLHALGNGATVSALDSGLKLVSVAVAFLLAAAVSGIATGDRRIRTLAAKLRHGLQRQKH
jgi:peptidoglycan biosynthesis protein MviN/MurJ (putative lipid II flippase)